MYELHEGYNSKQLIKSVEAKNRGEAFNFFRVYVREELGKQSMRGYTIHEGDDQS
ncbi:MAG: hypothetical protein WD512_02015 [Candidatus Paceibacterota bacterium]